MGICDGRVVIVTGGGRGLGRAHCLAFAAEGAKVVVNDLGASLQGDTTDESPGAEVVAEIEAAGGEAVVNGVDVSDWEGAGRLVEQAVDVFGGLDKPVPVTAPKSYFGNLGAGSAMVEIIAGILALKNDVLFATRNYRTPDPACNLDVVREARKPGDSFLKLSVTPQGQAACLLVKRFTA